LIRIIHIITSLGDGGAEHTLFKICKYDTSNKHIVISLTGKGKYTKLLKKIGIEVYNLKMNFFSIYKFFYLIKLLYNLKPEIVQTWLVHADLLGGIAAKIIGIQNIIWNARHSTVEIGKTKFSTILIIKLLAKLSFLIPKLIIVCSKSSKKVYENDGYIKKKLKMILNGYDLSVLNINGYQKDIFRKKNKINKNISIIGNVARYDPQKDHFNLLNALSIIKKKKIDFFCVLVGTNIKRNREIIKKIKNLGLSTQVKLLPQTNNIPQVMNGIDIHIQSSSYGEGFPNVIAEAMACGTPCIVTDVGDAAFIVKNNGWVVPPSNSIKLAESIEKALVQTNAKNWKKRCNEARLIIKKNFDISKMINSYTKLWNQVHNTK